MQLCVMLGRLRPLRIHVYEEGLATYTSEDIPFFSIRFWAAFLSSLKMRKRRRMGDCRFVDTLFVNHLDLHKLLFPEFDKKVRSFEVPLLEHLCASVPSCVVAPRLPENSAELNATLFLSGRKFNRAGLDVVATRHADFRLGKFHPGFVQANAPDGLFDLIVEGAAVAGGRYHGVGQ